MKIVCAQDELLSRLQLASRGVSQRSTVQILSGVLIDARNGSPELAATDMEISIRVPLVATVEEAGATRRCRGACCSTSCAPCRPDRSRSSSRSGRGRCA